MSQSEYHFLPISHASSTQQFCSGPEVPPVLPKKKEIRKKTQEITLIETPIEDAVEYAELDLTESANVNIKKEGKLDTSLNTEYFRLDSENQLIPTGKVSQDRVLSKVQEQEKVELLEIEGDTVSGAKKKSRQKKLEIDTIIRVFYRVNLKNLQYNLSKRNLH